MTIKWKITLSLVLVSLCLVVSYFYTAQSIFQNDKISYIYETQQSLVQDYAADFNKKVEDSIWLSRFFVRDYSSNGNNLSSDMSETFKAQKTLESIFIYNHSEKTQSPIVSADTAPNIDFAQYIPRMNLKKNEVVHIKDNYYLISIPIKGEALSNLGVVFQFAPDESAASAMQVFISENGQVLRNFGTPYIEPQSLTAYLQQQTGNKDKISSSTSSIKLDSKDYLVSGSNAAYGTISFTSLMDEAEALLALRELFNKSVIYLVIAILVTFIVALILSHQLTFGMRKLADSAAEIGKGHFDTPIEVESKDEVGVLAQAFKKMAQEIKLLFSQKLEKDRMERELQNARIIQERLFPLEKNVQINDFNLSGYYITSTECGGDWWHFYRSGFDLYFMIADATGHGIPAALITAASNAIFSHIKDETYSLEKIVQLWDEAVYQSSKGEVYMTAQIGRMNLASGNCELINLGHEMPILFKADKKTGSYLKMAANFCLGENSTVTPEIYQFAMDPGDHLLLYSDGIMAMMDDDATAYSDRQYLKKASALLDQSGASKQSAEQLFNSFRDVSKRTLPGFEDDVTLVLLSRQAKA